MGFKRPHIDFCILYLQHHTSLVLEVPADRQGSEDIRIRTAVRQPEMMACWVNVSRLLLHDRTISRKRSKLYAMQTYAIMRLAQRVTLACLVSSALCAETATARASSTSTHVKRVMLTVVFSRGVLEGKVECNSTAQVLLMWCEYVA